MLKKILILSILLMSSAFADEATDKAEFKKLYAEFNDLYANSEAIDPIIEVAEKLIKIAPKAYGKNHMNTAVVTYNLASLYDEKGGDTDTIDEKKALKLYRDYFIILDKNNYPKDKTFLQQFLQYVISDYNVNQNKTNKKLSNKLLNMLENSNVSKEETATMVFSIARLRINAGKFSIAEEPLKVALEYFESDVKKNKSIIGEIQYWMAMAKIKKIKNEKAAEYLDNVLKFYDGSIPDPNGFALNSYLYLYKLSFINRDYDACDRYFENYSKLDKTLKFAKVNYDDPSDILPIVRRNPRYPSKAAENGFEGFAVVSFTVNEEGETENIKSILSSHEIFEKPSINAAQKYKYRPRKINGNPVDVENVTVRIEYRLES